MRIRLDLFLLAASVLVTLPGALWARAPSTLPREIEIRRASAAVRVGDPEAALEMLSGLHPPAWDRESLVLIRLLRARALLLRGEAKAARKVLRPLMSRADPALSNAIWLVALRAAVQLPREDPDRVSAVAAAAQRLLRGADLPTAFRTEARWRLAELQSASPDEDIRRRGIGSLNRLVQDRDARALRVPILASLATLSKGKTRQAALRSLVVRHGDTPAGRRAARKLAPARLGLPERITRADRLMAARAYDLAETAYADLAGDGRAGAEVRQRAALRRAVIRMRLRDDYGAALRHLSAAEAGPAPGIAAESLYRKGIALGHLKRWDAAVAAMKAYVARAPRGPFALEAAYQSGRLLHQAGRYDEAVTAHEGFLSVRRPDRDKWLWFLGWSHFRGGRCASALAVWKALLPRRNLLVGAKALYWSARCHLILGEREAARRHLSNLRARAPLGYYGLLGWILEVQTFGDGSGSAVPLPPPRPAGLPLAIPEPVDLRAVERALGRREAASVLRRIRLASLAGFPEMGAQGLDLRRFGRRLRHLLGGPRSTAILDEVDRLLERFGARWRRRARRGRLPWNEGLLRQPEDRIREAYPPAWIDLARAAGRKHGVAPWWLLAHMLQESRFSGRSRSGAGAMGAMQILPRTGLRIAGRLGFPRGDFLASTLYRPGVALRHAAWYLAALREELGGATILAIAGYNGGPRLVSQHLRYAGDLPFDEMIEEIGAHQMRNYARKVTDHLVRYLDLYAGDRERAEVLRALMPPAHAPVPRGALTF